MLIFQRCLGIWVEKNPLGKTFSFLGIVRKKLLIPGFYHLQKNEIVSLINQINDFNFEYIQNLMK